MLIDTARDMYQVYEIKDDWLNVTNDRLIVQLDFVLFLHAAVRDDTHEIAYNLEIRRTSPTID